jgi:hypothetical protein
LISKFISGGQTGVDRAGLDLALELGLLHGGFVPQGRLAEDGMVPLKYNLVELSSTSYPVRTRANIRDSDATLILTPPPPLSRGTRLTCRLAQEMKKAWWAADPHDPSRIDPVVSWIKDVDPEVLNIAGPRESKVPGIHQISLEFLRKVFGCLS